jgi:hypothetical protein
MRRPVMALRLLAAPHRQLHSRHALKALWPAFERSGGAFGGRRDPVQGDPFDGACHNDRATVILADPIFQELAISLLFGLASSTLLTVLVIPAIYVVLRGEEGGAPPKDTPHEGNPPLETARTELMA